MLMKSVAEGRDRSGHARPAVRGICCRAGEHSYKHAEEMKMTHGIAQLDSPGLLGGAPIAGKARKRSTWLHHDRAAILAPAQVKQAQELMFDRLHQALEVAEIAAKLKCLQPNSIRPSRTQLALVPMVGILGEEWSARLLCSMTSE